MQRYRVNYKLFVGLIVAVAVAAGAVFGARQYNVSRNADTLLERANKAEAAEDLGEAISLLESYTEFRKGDTEAQVRLAHNYIKLTQETMTKEKEGNPRHYRTRASTLLARNPDDSQLRRALVDLDLKYSFVRYDEFNKETLSHIKILLNDSPEDVELIEGLALCLWFQKQPQQAAAELDKLIGYDPKTGEFDSSKALAPDRLEAYSYYSQIAYLPQGATLASLNQQRLARAVLDQMVTANPDDAKAYLTRGVWFSRYDRGPDDARYDFEALARQDLLKAVELDPQNADAMNAVAEHFLKLGREALISAEEARQRAQVDTHQEQKEKAERLLDTARDYYEQGRKLEPKAPQFYVRLAALERVRGNKEKGKEIIEQALRQLDGEAKTTVLFSQADYMIDDRELDEANKLLRQLEGTLRGHPRLLSLQGKFAIQKGDWRGARETFKELLPRLMSDSDLKVQTLLGLALCHQKLAEPELARKCYEQVLEIDPENQMAMQLVSGGSRSVARANPQRQSNPGAGGDVTQATIVDGMTAEAKKPESEQNWAPFEQYIKNRAEIENLSPTRVNMARSELARFRKKYAEAEKLLSEALKEADTDPESSEQTDVLLAAINLAAVNPNRGPAEAIKMMDTLVARFGDSPMFNIQRVRLLGALNDDTMVEKILEISRQTEGWEKREVDTLWAVIASVFEQTRHPEEAEMALKKLVELREGDLPIRIRLFKSALARNDNQGMQEAQEEILKIVGSKKDSNWAFTEAARLFATGAAGSEQTQDEVNRLLTAILRERGDWHEPYLLRAKLKLVKNDPQGALEDFTKGLSLGQGTLIDLRAYSQLLIAQNRWSDIVELVEPYPLDARIFILGENYARALFINERYTDSMEAAERTLAMANPATAELQLWYAQFLDSIIAVPAEKIPADERARFTDMQQQCREKQKLAIDEAIAMRPDSPGVWLAKVRHRLLTQKIGEAIATTQEAQLVMEEDVEPLLMAECFTSLGRWFDAENAYLALREKNPDNTTLARQLGEFYLSQMYPRPDKIDKASRLINMVLEKTAQDRSSVPEVDAQWARRAAARVLAAKGDYQSLLNAEKLLASNSDKGVLPVADKLEMASILAPRPEQISKLKAIQLLEEVKHQASLDLKQELLLANLYFQTDNWRDARPAASPTPFDRPSAAVQSPANNAQVRLGETIEVQYSVRDNQGLTRVELRRLNRVIMSTPIGGQQMYQGYFTYEPDSTGTHTLEIVPWRDDVRGDPASITLYIVAD